jgi:hypothetical protein
LRIASILLLLGLSGAAIGVRAASAASENTPSLTLIWTAPGDDGTSGTAVKYDLRMSASPISETNFAQAYQITFVPLPKPAGQQQQLSISNLSPGTKYYFALKTRDDAGNWSPMSNLVSTITDLAAEAPTAIPLQMSQPSPNPARAGTSFSVGLPQQGHVHIEIFDVTGRRVRLLVDRDAAPGWSTERWDLRDDYGMPVSGGVYYALGRIGSTTFSRRVTVLH